MRLLRAIFLVVVVSAFGSVTVAAEGVSFSDWNVAVEEVSHGKQVTVQVLATSDRRDHTTFTIGVLLVSTDGRVVPGLRRVRLGRDSPMPVSLMVEVHEPGEWHVATAAWEGTYEFTELSS